MYCSNPTPSEIPKEGSKTRRVIVSSDTAAKRHVVERIVASGTVTVRQPLDHRFDGWSEHTSIARVLTRDARARQRRDGVPTIGS
jgi:hypothetical protein